MPAFVFFPISEESFVLEIDTDLTLDKSISVEGYFVVIVRCELGQILVIFSVKI